LDTQIFMSTLTIYSVSSSDYGPYACEAKNSLGPGQIAKAVLSGKRKLRILFLLELESLNSF
jgi:hypothetical protein